MERPEQECLSPEIVSQGVQNSGPYAGSPSFSVRVRRSLPDFLNSVNLKYVKLGYGYLLNHIIYFVAAPVVLMLFGTQIGKVTFSDLWLEYDVLNIISLLGFLVLIIYIYFDLTPCSTYLVDFACYRPPTEFKVCVISFFSLFSQNEKCGYISVSRYVWKPKHCSF